MFATHTIKTVVQMLLISVLTCISVGCTRNPADPQDPYESYNRKVFKFNMVVDKVVYRPIAKTYDTLVPKPVHRGITNIYSNITEIPNVANDLLQANFKQALSDTGRFVANTVFCLGGICDFASTVGLKKHDQDFGLTMAKWGLRQSPYLLLPFMGPGTARDQFAFFVNYQFLTIYPYIYPRWQRYTIYGLKLVNDRAALLSADQLIDEAFDPYVFVRDAYLQARNAQINEMLHKQSADQQALVEAAAASNAPIIGQAISQNQAQPAVANSVVKPGTSQATTQKQVQTAPASSTTTKAKSQ